MSKHEKSSDADSQTCDRYEYVPGEKNELIFCKTCGKITYFPKQTCKASHIHCGPCIENSTICPTCKKEPHFRDSVLATEILEDLEVFCTNKMFGCKWQGKQIFAMSHFREECIHNHCPRKQTGCNWSGKETELSEHEEICGFVCVPCPNNCSASLIRNELASHDDECTVLIARKKKEEKKKLKAAQLKRQQAEKKKQQAILEIEENRRKEQENTGKQVISEVVPQAEEIVPLNVGGTLFITSKSSLSQARSSAFFACLLERKHNMSDTFFLDRNPKIFAMLLDYLRYGSSVPIDLKTRELQLLLVEAIFWCIPQLAEELMRYLATISQIGTQANTLEICSISVPGRDFSKWHFRNLKFYNCIFDASSFEHAVFSNVKFYECSFETCSFPDATFESGTLNNCKFRSANLKNLSLESTETIDCEFIDTICIGTKFSKQSKRCNFSGSEITDNFTGMDLSSMIFEGCDLAGCKLTNAKMTQCNLQYAILPEQMVNVSLESANLSNCDLSKVSFRGSSLDKIVITDAILPSELRQVSIKGTDLSRRTLTSSFNGSDFTACNLSKSKLKGDFSNCNFKECKMKGTSFHRAKLEKTILPKNLTTCSFFENDLSLLGSSDHVVTGMCLKQNTISFELLGPEISKCDFSQCVILGKVSDWKFDGIKLEGSDFRESSISGCDFVGSSLHGILLPETINESRFPDLTKVCLAGKSFQSCYFENTCFPRDLSNVSFCKCEFSNCNFTNCVASGSTFNDCNLQEICLPLDISDCNFNNCDLSCCDLSKNQVIGAAFEGCNLKELLFPEDISGCSFDNCDLSSYNLSKHHISGTKFLNCKLGGSGFFPADISGCNFKGQNMSGIDLSKLRVTGANFAGCNIVGTQFPEDISNCNFQGCDLSDQDILKHQVIGANFSGCIFSETVRLPVDIRHCDFSKCSLSIYDLSKHQIVGANFSECKFTDKIVLPVDISGCNFSGYDFSAYDLYKHTICGANFSLGEIKGTLFPVDISGCNFQGCDLSGCDLSKHRITGAVFSGCKFVENFTLPADISGCSFEECDLSNVDLSQRDLSSCKVRGALFCGCKVTGTTFPSDLQSCNFSGCNLSGFDFSTYSVTGAVFQGFSRNALPRFPNELSDCNFSRSDLSYQNFNKANVSGCDFSSCTVRSMQLPNNLENCNFSQCNLSGLNFSHSNLSGANLSGVSISSLKLSEDTQLEGVKLDLFPDSKLLSGKEQILLTNWAKKNGPGTLLFRASEAALNGANFHQQCDHKGQTFSIIKCKEGNIFGGFAAQAWNSNQSSIHAPGSFLFTLRNPHLDPPTLFHLKKNCSDALYGLANNGPVFGGGHDISINYNCMSGTIYFSNSYQDNDHNRGYYAFTQSSEFEVEELEVYSFSN